MQEQPLEIRGEPWQEGPDQYVRLAPGSPAAMPVGVLQILTRDSRYLHVVQNSLKIPARVMEIYVRPLEKIRYFEPTEQSDIYRELVIRKTYTSLTPAP